MFGAVVSAQKGPGQRGEWPQLNTASNGESRRKRRNGRRAKRSKRYHSVCSIAHDHSTSSAMGGKMTPTSHPEAETVPAKITKRIEELGDWRGETLARIRQLIHDADPEIQEEWKWEKPSSPGIPVWSHDGGVCTGETYQEKVKLTFFRGASLRDPKNLFTQPGTVRRAIDLQEGDEINEDAFKELVRAAVAANAAARSKRSVKKK